MLPVTYWCCHLTRVEDGFKWRRGDWNSRGLVRGLKGEPFKGELRLRIDGRDRTYNSANIENFIDWVLPRIGRRLIADVGRPIDLVPIPNSGMATGACGPFRIVELARKVAGAHDHDIRVVEAIRWHKPRTKAHQSKEFRHPGLFEPHMRLAATPERPVVLFDDVVTSGSQMIAAARFLTKQGYEVVSGLAVAHATSVQEENPFLNRKLLELDTSEDFCDLSEF